MFDKLHVEVGAGLTAGYGLKIAWRRIGAIKYIDIEMSMGGKDDGAFPQDYFCFQQSNITETRQT
jgi:hypothetical protein